MDWNRAIEKNREALKQVLASLVAMAACLGGGPTLPRRLHRAILRLLRPAESAVRRLVVVAARDLVPPPPRPRAPAGPRPHSVFLKRPGGTGILLPRGMKPPGWRPRSGTFSLSLVEPLKRFRPPRVRQVSVPRIIVPFVTVPFPVPPRRLPMPDDPLDARRLTQRLDALARVLGDLPAAALKLARWRARGEAARRQHRPARIWPLRPGRAPGAVRRPTHDVHDILAVLQGLAFWVREELDTS